LGANPQQPGIYRHNVCIARSLIRGSSVTKSISVAEAKARFSELVNRESYGGERFLIQRRGKPVGAIISVEDLARLE
jgi:prevent-host-death family protein